MHSPAVKRVLGIDPGSRIAGYGVVEEKGNRLSAIGYGVVRPPDLKEVNQRYKYLFEAVGELIVHYHPDEVVIENIFVAHNSRSALLLGHARCASMLPVLLSGIPLHEYSALQVKKAVTGGGRAEKEQVAQMVCRLLGLKETPKPEDVTDALAVAICHIHSTPLRKKLAGL